VVIAGTDDKLKWCGELGFDAGINYKKAADLTQAVKEASGGGVDVFFDNTAGPIHDAVMKNLRTGARMVICASTGLWPRIVSVRGTAANDCLVHNTAQGARATPALRVAAEAFIKLSGA
jgi:NADPH-dependent curcumin reductase CurA